MIVIDKPKEVEHAEKLDELAKAVAALTVLVRDLVKASKPTGK